jgi:emp24/gp25L/p24 family/GOLD
MSSDPIVARFESDTTVLWSSTPGDPEGTFELEVHDGGLHRFCLENGKHEMGDGLDRTIGWAVRVRPLARSLGEGEEGPDALRALNLADWASELQDQWQTLLDHYSFMKAREVMHTELTDSILGRVVRWTIFEAVTLILIATGQILYLRKFMETKRYL